MRLIHGDEHPDGPGFIEEEVDCAANGSGRWKSNSRRLDRSWKWPIRSASWRWRAALPCSPLSILFGLTSGIANA